MFEWEMIEHESADTAFHESGHAVVSLAFRRRFEDIVVNGEEGAVRGTGLRLPENLHFARKFLTINVAGLIAEELFHEWIWLRRLLSRGEQQMLVSRGLRSRVRMGERLRIGQIVDATKTDCDASNAVFLASVVRQRKVENHRKAGFAMIGAYFNIRSNCYHALEVTPEVLAEIRRAERRAERLLRQNWEAVLKLAESLLRRRTGRMTLRQVLRLIGQLVVPESPVA